MTGRHKTQEQAIEAAQLLLDRGFDINAQANDGQTAEHRRRHAGLRRRHPVLGHQGRPRLDIPADKDGFTLRRCCAGAKPAASASPATKVWCVKPRPLC